jgi:hypothetical protein
MLSALYRRRWGEDFQKESSHMDEVYGNATITIAAEAAKNVEEGIFQRLCPDSSPTCQIPYDLADGTIGTAIVRSKKLQYGKSREGEPWNTRAWTLQERILLQCIIIFYKDQLSWDCSSTLINANGPLNPRLNSTKDRPGRYSDFVALKDQQRDLPQALLSKCMEYWKYVVLYYAKRKLSHKDDKLNALAGLAKLTASKTIDSYIAGLWQSDLRAQLMLYEELKSRKLRQYRAPLWLWASIEGAVQFINDDVTLDILDMRIIPLRGA